MWELSDFIKMFNVSSQRAQPDISIQAKMGKSPINIIPSYEKQLSAIWEYFVGILQFWINNSLK